MQEHVDDQALVQHLAGEGAHGGERGEVEDPQLDAAAGHGVVDLLDGLLAALVVPRGEQDPVPGPRQLLGGGEAEAAASAGHDDRPWL
nr:hypothetical protein [Nannocystis sp.]